MRTPSLPRLPRLLSLLPLPVLALVLAGCPDDKKAMPTDPTATPPTAKPPTSASAAPSGSAAAAAGPKAAFSTKGFATPESVVYDADADRYLVSNVNGKPTEADGNGYITVLSPEGKVTTEKWIEGGKNKATLNAPKGMAIVNGVLYVADLDTVRTFDVKTGAPKADIKLAGATFANDVAAGLDGKVYVSDSGLKQNAKGDFEPTNTDAVWTIDKGKATALAKDPSLGRPNGLILGPTGLWVVTFGTGELYRLDDKGKKQDAVKLPKGSLDGILLVNDSLYVSSWEASAVYKGKPAGPFEIVIPNVKSPADIGFDTKRNRVLVPLFTENTVEAYDVK
jgi:sugar lactone lactonase YvrE